MSWDAWVAPLMPTFKAAAIFGLDGGVWVNKGITADARKLATLFKTPSPAFAEGITINGTKYLCVKADDASVYGKKGPGGCCAVKSAKAIIVGVYDENTTAGNAANAIEKLCQSLKDAGF